MRRILCFEHAESQIAMWSADWKASAFNDHQVLSNQRIWPPIPEIKSHLREGIFVECFPFNIRNEGQYHGWYAITSNQIFLHIKTSAINWTRGRIILEYAGLERVEWPVSTKFLSNLSPRASPFSYLLHKPHNRRDYLVHCIYGVLWSSICLFTQTRH